MGEGYFKFRDEAYQKSRMEEAISKIYSKIVDDNSREIFVNCVMYSLTKKAEFLRKNILLTEDGRTFDKLLDEIGQKPIFVYGAGERGRRLVEMFPDKNWGGFIDKSKTGKCNGLSILSLCEIDRVKDTHIIISVLNGWEKIKQELVFRGVKGNYIFILENWNELIRNEQYVEKRCLAGCELKGGLIDAGAFDGSDVERISKCFADKSIRAWVFEPDGYQMQQCKEKLIRFPNIEFFEKGLSSCSAKKRLNISTGGLTKVSDDGEVEIDIVSLDEVLLQEKVGFIKMDIEGFEEEALKGAEKIITIQKPIVAVSIYHKAQDIWKIPELLLKFNPNYKFALGHYSIGQVDTVMYAIDFEGK